MSKASILADARETDERYRSLYITEWDARLNETREVARTTQLPDGLDHWRFGEIVAGLTSAPLKGEGSEYDSYAPEPGKNVSYSTDIYKFAFRATEEMRKFGRSQQILEYPRLMAEIMDLTIKVQIYNKYNRGFATDVTEYDGAVLFKADHALSGSTSTGRNLLAAAADLSETTVEGLIELLIKTPNEDGVYMGVAPRTLMVSTNQWGAATRITQSTTTTLQGSGESGNAINAVTRAWNIVPHFSPYITDTDATYLLAERPPVNVVFAGSGGQPAVKPVYIDPETDDWVWRVKGQFRTVVDTWRGSAATPGA